MPEDNVAANWFVDVLRLGVANAYDAEDADALAWQADALALRQIQRRLLKKVAQQEMPSESAISAR